MSAQPFDLSDPDVVSALIARLRHASDSDKATLDALLENVPEAPPRLTLRDWAARVAPGYRWWKHNRVLGDRLEDVAAGRIRRLLVVMPPRYGKSTTISQLFLSYYLHQFPARWAGLACYADPLAHYHAERAREMYRLGGGLLQTVADEERSMWRSSDLGGLWIAGVKGSITGRGGHLLILDDPLKNALEANSEVVRRGLIDWWQSTWVSRLEPNGALVVVMTRWNPDDLIGYLIRQDEAARDTEAGPEGWHVVHFREVATDEPLPYPDTMTIEPDWRRPGEVLCPERFPPEVVARKRARASTYYWNAMHQGTPVVRAGYRFKAEWFKKVTALPAHFDRLVRYWDLAGTDSESAAIEDDDPDYTAGALVGLSDGNIYVADITRAQRSPAGRDAMIRVTADKDRERFGSVVIWLEAESGIQGEDRTRAIVRQLGGFEVHTERPTGDKQLRAEPFAGQAEPLDESDPLAAQVLASQAKVGNVCYLEGEWNAAWLDELCAFPHGSHDDQVDATCAAYAKLVRGSPVLAGVELGQTLLPTPEFVSVFR